MSFRFAVPDLESSLAVDMIPRRLQALCSELAEMETADAARTLNGYLHTANRAPAKTDDRLRTLEALLPTAKHLLGELAHLYETGPLPLAGVHREAASAARTLQIELLPLQAQFSSHKIDAY